VILVQRTLWLLARLGLVFMAKPSSTGIELAPTVYEGTFVATGQSASFLLFGSFNLFLSGFGTATVLLQRSYDGGTTWVTCGADALGTPASYTANASVVFSEPEPGMLYRLNCTAHAAGTIAYRISGGNRPT